MQLNTMNVSSNMVCQHNIPNKIVVIYTFFKSDVAEYNLNFFVKKELTYKKNIDYVLVINGYSCNVTLPDITNLTVLKRENKGFDFGGHAHALNHLEKNNLTYKHYFFMNSGVFGPIIPAYIKTHWSTIFIEKMAGLVKIVGTSIACLKKTDLGGYGPKVEGFFFLTDSEGLKLLLDEKTIFCDHADKTAAIVDGEYGLTRCIMKHGYTIDCMLEKYSGLDWFKTENWDLNRNLHPTRRNTYFGKSINPYDVVFHKWYWANQPTVNYEMIKEYAEQTI